jgi:hypothetical protein
MLSSQRVYYFAAFLGLVAFAHGGIFGFRLALNFGLLGSGFITERQSTQKQGMDE